MKNGESKKEWFGRLSRLSPYVPLIVAAILAVTFFRAWYFGHGFLTFGDWKILLEQSSAGDFPVPTLWRYNAQIGAPSTNFFPFYAAIAWFAHVHAGFPISERVLFFCLFPPVLLSGFWFFTYALTENRFAASVAAFIAFFNTEVLLSAFGGHTNATNAIAFAPWALLGTFQGVRKRSAYWFAVSFIAYFMICAYDVRWIPPVFVLTVLFSVLALRGATRKFGKFAILGVAVSLFAIFAENCYWILPKLAGFSVSPAPPAINLQTYWVAASSVLNWLDAAASWNPYFPNDYRNAPLIVEHLSWPFIVIPLITLIFGFAAIRRYRFVAVAAIFIYVIGAFLVKGSNPPFGSLYGWCFAHVPLFDAYRDPSKFAFLVIIGMTLCVATGMTSLQACGLKRSSKLLLIVFSVFVVAENAHAFALVGAGVTAERTLPPQYIRLNAVLSADPSYGRVLALPTSSRWMQQTTLHPVIDASDIATAEFAPWSNPTSTFTSVPFLYSADFENLLHWTAVRYVVIDDSVYDDATIGGFGESLVRLRDLISRMVFLERIGTFGSATLYRVRGPSPHVWTSDTATQFSGKRNDLNALALLPRLASREPIVIERRGTSSASFHRVVTVGVSRTPIRAPESDEIAVAASVQDTPFFAASVISPQLIRAPAGSRIWVAKGQSTVPLSDRVHDLTSWSRSFNGGTLLEGHIPAALRFRDADGSVWNFRALRIVNHRQRVSIENRMPVSVHGVLRIHCMLGRPEILINGLNVTSTDKGDVIARVDVPPGRSVMQLIPLTGYPVITGVTFSGRMGNSSRVGSWLTVRTGPMHLYDSPEIVFRPPAHGSDRYLAALHFRDRRNEERYIVPLADAQYLGTVDLRTLLWWKYLAWRGGSEHDRAINDSYDYFDLEAISLRPLGNSSKLPSSAMLEVIEHSASVEPIGAATATSVPGIDSAFVIPPGVGSWVGRSCSIRYGNTQKDVYVMRADGVRIVGIASDGTLLDMPWSRISSIGLSSSVFAFQVSPTVLKSHMNTLLFNFLGGVPLDVRIAVLATDKKGRSSIVSVDAPAVGALNLVSLKAALRSDAVRNVFVFLLRQPDQTGTEGLLAGSLLQIPGGHHVPSRLFLSRRGPVALVATTLGTGQTPLLVGMQQGESRSANVHLLKIGAFRTVRAFQVHSRDKWLILSEAYGAGWQLRDERDRPIGEHRRVYGILNAWFVRGGLDGTYRLVYKPDTIAPIGFWFGFISLAVAVGAALLALSNRRLRL